MVERSLSMREVRGSIPRISNPSSIFFNIHEKMIKIMQADKDLNINFISFFHARGTGIDTPHLHYFFIHENFVPFTLFISF